MYQNDLNSVLPTPGIDCVMLICHDPMYAHHMLSLFGLLSVSPACLMAECGLTQHSSSCQVGVIKSALLTRTLFDVYLGSNPVSPDAKDSIGRGLKNLATEP